jgi:2-polyprenyl-3-methyl-5-hydroxy-6-metoxy-1,4-benzoquinol methylase
MIKDWYSPKLCSAWINEMDNNGDLPRRIFSLPIVTGVLNDLIKRNSISQGSMENYVKKYSRKNEINIKAYCNNDTSIILNCLDLGCGEGYLGRILSNWGVHYLGLDGSPYLLESAISRSNSEKLKYRITNLDLFDSTPKKNTIHYTICNHFGSEGPSIIFLHSVIEHLINFELFLSHLSAWVKTFFPKVIVSLICLEEKFFFETNADNYSEASSASCIEVPNTDNYVRIKFYSDDSINRIIKRSNFFIIDRICFKKSLYDSQTLSSINRKLGKWKHGPFRAYLLKI